MKKLIVSVLLILIFMVPASAQRRYHDDRDYRRYDKCEKFVNCHDARDGRWNRRRYYYHCEYVPVIVRVGRHTRLVTYRKVCDY